jgi:hypothetical protein
MNFYLRRAYPRCEDTAVQSTRCFIHLIHQVDFRESFKPGYEVALSSDLTARRISIVASSRLRKSKPAVPSLFLDLLFSHPVDLTYRLLVYSADAPCLASSYRYVYFCSMILHRSQYVLPSSNPDVDPRISSFTSRGYVV